HLLRIHLLDEGADGRRWRQFWTDVGKAPSGGCVPDVLYSRVVVSAYAPEQSVAIDVYGLREAYVRVIPSEVMGDAIQRSLNECAYIVSESPTGEEAHLLHDKVVVDTEAGCSTARLSALGIGESRLQHNCKRRALPIPSAQGVATQFEASA